MKISALSLAAKALVAIATVAAFVFLSSRITVLAALYVVIAGTYAFLSSLPFVAFHRLSEGDVGYVTRFSQVGRKVLKGPYLIHIWPIIEKVYIYNTLPKLVKMNDVTLTTGGANKVELTLKEIKARVAVVDASLVFAKAPEHSGSKAALYELEKAVGNVVTGKTLEALDKTGKEGIERDIERLFGPALKKYGMALEDEGIAISDQDWDDAVKEASRLRVEAQGRADAATIESENEIAITQRQYEEQEKLEGGLWKWQQGWDNLANLVERGAKHGAFQVVGDLSGMIGKLFTKGDKK